MSRCNWIALTDERIHLDNKVSKVLALGLIGLLAVLLYAVLIALTGHSVPRTEGLNAKNGVMDLRQVNLQQTGGLALSGEWDFYWMQLLEPKQVRHAQSSKSLMPLPNSWNNQISEKMPFPALGHATYQLALHLADTQPLALRIPDIGTAYKLYIDDELVSQSGVVTSGMQGFVPAYKLSVVPFTPASTRITLTIQVANYAYDWGGIWFALELGSIESAYQQQTNTLLKSIFIIGIFVVAAVYSLIQFILRTVDPLPFVFALLCITLAVREIVAFHVLALTAGIHIPFALEMRVEYLTFACGLVLWMGFLQLSFPKDFNYRFMRVAYLFSTLFGLLVLISPPLVFSKVLIAFEVFACVNMLYVSLCLWKAWRNKRPSVGIIAFGCLLLFAGIINEILYTLEVVEVGHILGFSMVGLIICQCFSTYGRFVRATNERSVLSEQLEKRNQELQMLSNSLEEKVQQRTSELEQANKKLDELAHQDALTGVLNRRGVMLHIQQALAKHRRDASPFSLILLDLDKFKLVNDQLGHEEGDKVLKNTAATLLIGSREQDKVARWGGEEFLIFLPDTQAKGALVLAEKMRLLLENPTNHAATTATVTATFGVAEYVGGEHFTQTLARADKALYQGKANGRNRVELAD